IDDEALLSSVLSQYYAAADSIPDEILLPLELEDRVEREQLYGEQRGRKTKIFTPQRGVPRRLLELAQSNAAENFRARFHAALAAEEPLRALQRSVGLDQAPRTIECVDISHFQGGETVASVVFFQDGVPDKARYRHFNLESLEKPDDFESMRQVLRRHLSRSAEEDTLSDLLVVDGGPGQLGQAMTVRRELGLDRPVLIGLAKRRRGSAAYRTTKLAPEKPERVYTEFSSAPVSLVPGTPACMLLERIRDEAHRFAITFHRNKRRRRTLVSRLDAIPGIGPNRRKRLLREFGNIGAIRAASVDELTERGSLPRALAERVHARLQKDAQEPE
ncbi:MAG: hypothetical protein KDD44_05440, partial [Bdellovibrionales bacterium]|nr:hypothetical protein [Bdellovibrionales bacterium]